MKKEKIVDFRVKFSNIKLILEPDGKEFHVYSPILKGLHTCGSTEQEAWANAEDAIIGYLLSVLKHGYPPDGLVIEKESIERNRRTSYNAYDVNILKRTSCETDLAVAFR